MSTVSGSTLTERLDWRYATKKFDPSKKIEAAEWAVLEQALVKSPSSYGLQPWKFLVVENAELRAELRKVSWNQTQITDASHLVVLCARTNLNAADVEAHVARIAQLRQVPLESLDGYRKVMMGFLESSKPGFDINQWSARQVYIALGFLLSAAALVGIDACPMEGFDAAAYNKLLGLDQQGYSATVVCTLGYRAADDTYANARKVRFEQERVLEHIR